MGHRPLPSRPACRTPAGYRLPYLPATSAYYQRVSYRWSTAISSAPTYPVDHLPVGTPSALPPLPTPPYHPGHPAYRPTDTLTAYYHLYLPVAYQHPDTLARLPVGKHCSPDQWVRHPTTVPVGTHTRHDKTSEPATTELGSANCTKSLPAIPGSLSQTGHPTDRDRQSPPGLRAAHNSQARAPYLPSTVSSTPLQTLHGFSAPRASLDGPFKALPSTVSSHAGINGVPATFLPTLFYGFRASTYPANCFQVGSDTGRLTAAS